MVRMIVVVACSLAVLSVGATAQDMRDHRRPTCRALRNAYNRKDADAMAGAFAEDGTR